MREEPLPGQEGFLLPSAPHARHPPAARGQRPHRRRTSRTATCGSSTTSARTADAGPSAPWSAWSPSTATHLKAIQAQDDLRRAQNENAAAMKSVGKLAKDEQGAAREQADRGGSRPARAREVARRRGRRGPARARRRLGAASPTSPTPRPRAAAPTTTTASCAGSAPSATSRRGFAPKDHVALGEALDLVDFEAGAKVAGQKFYFLKNEAVLLELALMQYAMQTLRGARLHAGHHAGPRPRRGAAKASASCRAASRDADLHASPTPTCA